MRHVIVARRFLFCVRVLLLFFLPFGQVAFQAVYLCLVRVVLLAVRCRVLHTRLGDFLQQRGILVLQCLNLRLKQGDFVVCFLHHTVQFGEVQFILRDRGLHGTLL